MKDLIIITDPYDDEYYHVYEIDIANGKPWRKVFTLFVSDVEPLLGKSVADALFSPEYGSTQAKFSMPEAQEVEAL